VPDKPRTAEGYGPEFLERARRTCLHVATVIGETTDDVVLVGDLVPSLIVAQGSPPSGREGPRRVARETAMAMRGRVAVPS